MVNPFFFNTKKARFEASMQRLLGQAAQRNNVGMASWMIDPVPAERAGHSADPRGTNIQRRMNRLLLTLAITVAASGLIFPNPTVAQPRPAGEKAERVQIIERAGARIGYR
jgi:hypothetical protein